MHHSSHEFFLTYFHSYESTPSFAQTHHFNYYHPSYSTPIITLSYSPLKLINLTVNNKKKKKLQVLPFSLSPPQFSMHKFMIITTISAMPLTFNYPPNDSLTFKISTNC